MQNSTNTQNPNELKNKDEIATKLIHIHTTVRNTLAFLSSSRGRQHPLGLFNYLLKVTSVGGRHRAFEQGLRNTKDTKITHVLILLRLNGKFWNLWSILLTPAKLTENSSMKKNIILPWSLFQSLFINGKYTMWSFAAILSCEFCIFQR